MSDSIDRGVKIPVFAGTSEAWTTWEPRFISTVDLKGYGESLTGDLLITSNVGEIVAFKNKNREAYNGLLLANDTREFIQLITAQKTAEYLRGDARKAFQALENKFKPKDKHTKLELKKQWAQMKFDDVEEYPETWITELTNLRHRLAKVKVKIEEEDFWLQVLSNLP